jgi:uncharacterized membrane protein YhiD involved in acid resistance
VASVSAFARHLLKEPYSTRRLAGSGLITGIGFIGGGAIVKQSGAVQGTATAAGLWAPRAVGDPIGLGSYDVAILAFRGLSPLKQQKQPGDDIDPNKLAVNGVLSG